MLLDLVYVSLFIYLNVAITCPPLPFPVLNVDQILYDAVPNPINYPFETAAEYRCNEGFELVSGDQVRTCYENGNSTIGIWSGVEPVCQGEYSFFSSCPECM